MPKTRPLRDTMKALGLVEGLVGFVLGLILIALLVAALHFLPRFTGV